ncbi:MAG: OmpA family protein [Saprospiraceae bacterium]|nr:OmpA family protein [Saprospiraceae bacterium]
MNSRIFIVFFIVCLYSCSYQYKIRTGDQAFSVKQYAKAASFYKSEYTQSPSEAEKAEKAYKLGLCAKFASDYTQALYWFRTAYDLNFGPDALREYAVALKFNGEYEAAANAFGLYGDEIKRPSEVRKDIQICKLMQQWSQTPTNYSYQVSEVRGLNFDGSAYGYQKFSGDEWLFVAEKWKETLKQKNKFEWTGRPFSDLFVKAGETVKSFDFFNSPANEGAFCYSDKSMRFFMTRCDKIINGKELCKIYESTRNRQSWSEPEEMIFFEEPSSQMHPAMHASDSIFVFSSDHIKGEGKFDLFYMIKSGEDWSDPVNFGESINTDGDEVFPVWYGDTLFFSSSGITGMGGLDIFKTHLTSTGQWAPPVNLRNPINSEADDFHFFVDTASPRKEREVMRAYFSSNRGDSGLDRIYMVSVSEKVEETSPWPEKPNYKFEILAKIKFVEPGSYAGSEQKILDSINFIDKSSKMNFNTGSGKILTLKLQQDTKFEFVITRPGYLNRDIMFATPDAPVLDRDSTFTMELVYELIPLVYNKEFLLKELYYDFDKWDIREDAVASLLELRDIMLKNPKVNVLIGSHTDCRGLPDYNKELSEKRARSAVQWLQQNGVAETRMTYKGFGSEFPAASCECQLCTETQHQFNRRSTFQLIPDK